MSYPLVIEGRDEQGLNDRSFSHTGVPLLASFDFQFQDGLLGSIDRHIQQILINPNPDFEPDKMQLGYHDSDKDTDYEYMIVHQIVDAPGILRLRRSLDICSEIECSVPIERPTGDFVFVLVGFQLSYQGTDHHIKRVRLLEWDGNLKIRFRDNNDDPPPISEYSVQYAYVPSSLFIELGSSSGRNNRADGTDIPAGPSVIRGFSLEFPHDDHHLRRIGVLTGDGRLEVRYADLNGDDPFDWYVDWGILAI
jgi:hypothetical protein